jgi:hypothetical protein
LDVLIAGFNQTLVELTVVVPQPATLAVNVMVLLPNVKLVVLMARLKEGAPATAEANNVAPLYTVYVLPTMAPVIFTGVVVTAPQVVEPCNNMPAEGFWFTTTLPVLTVTGLAQPTTEANMVIGYVPACRPDELTVRNIDDPEVVATLLIATPPVVDTK